MTHPSRIRAWFGLGLAGACLSCGAEDTTQRGGRDAGSGGAAGGGTSSGAAAGTSAGGAATGGAAAGGRSGGGTGGAATGGSGAAPGAGFARYDPTAVSSPITPSVLAEAADIAARNGAAQDSVFMKVGASGTVSKSFMYCFAGSSQPSYELELNGRDLLPSINYFRAGNAAGTTPFDRATLAAVVGRSAGWVIAGEPSPLTQELDLLNPRFAFVNYGTNDMGLGATYLSALFPFYANMSALLDQLEARGVVSVISGLNPRGDSASAARWVPTYDAVTRGLAERRQLAYLSLYLASKDLPQQGLLSDGIHGNSYISGGAQPCVFSPRGLEFNYNVRNLLSMQLLDQLKRGLVDGQAAADPTPKGYSGTGSVAAPIEIDRLPFTHSGDTTQGASLIHSYPGCGASQDESGPEIYYRLQLERDTALRVLLLSDPGVDADLHLLTLPHGDACLQRNDRALQTQLAAGSYYLSVDSFAGGGAAPSGRYLLVVLECEPGDPDC